MWNFFARESFPYELVEKVGAVSGLSVFSLNDGIKKVNKIYFSALICTVYILDYEF